MLLQPTQHNPPPIGLFFRVSHMLYTSVHQLYSSMLRIFLSILITTVRYSVYCLSPVQPIGVNHLHNSKRSRRYNPTYLPSVNFLQTPSENNTLNLFTPIFPWQTMMDRNASASHQHWVIDSATIWGSNSVYELRNEFESLFCCVYCRSDNSSPPSPH